MDDLLIYCDGGSRGNPGPAGIGAVVLDPSTTPPAQLAVVSERIGVATNNVAEYEALIAALEQAAPFGASRIVLRADSMLVLRQVEGKWKIKQPHLAPLARRARELLEPYESVVYEHVPREENIVADALVNAALDAG